MAQVGGPVIDRKIYERICGVAEWLYWRGGKRG
jgi:hypothetical protein